jgi:hypothetical protein
MRPVGAEILNGGGQTYIHTYIHTYRHDETDSRFAHFCERARSNEQLGAETLCEGLCVDAFGFLASNYICCSEILLTDA